MQARVRTALLIVGLMLLCGVGPAAAIVGGYLVPAGQFPFAARILITDGSSHSQCSGSVVRPDVVMTAAHCVVNASTGRLLSPRDFVVDTTGPDVSVGDAYAHTVGQVLRYPKFSVTTRRGDIAFLQLTSASGAHAVRLAGAADASWAYLPGRAIWAAGFGMLSASAAETPSQPLYAVKLAVLNRTTCTTDDARGLPYIPSAMFCGALPSLKQGICYGDSGGPVVEPSPSGTLMEVGLTSYVSTSTGSCTPPSYFVRLIAFAPWISTQIAHLQLTSACPTLRVHYRQGIALIAYYRRLLGDRLSTSVQRRMRTALSRATTRTAWDLAALCAHACG